MVPYCDPSWWRFTGDRNRAPALLVGGLAVGHTQDGIKFNVQPDIRVRTVDEHGSAKADVIYQGETIEISATLAEKTAANLRRVYAWGMRFRARDTLGVATGPSRQ